MTVVPVTVGCWFTSAAGVFTVTVVVATPTAPSLSVT